MDIIQLREYILSLPSVEEVMPFDDAAVFKVAGKWIAAYIFERPEYIAVKCNPDRAVLLRDEFGAITPAWHFNKRHWNDLKISDLPDDILKREICHSYMTVIKKNITPKSLREELLENAKKRGIEDTPLPE